MQHAGLAFTAKVTKDAKGYLKARSQFCLYSPGKTKMHSFGVEKSQVILQYNRTFSRRCYFACIALSFNVEPVKMYILMKQRKQVIPR